MEEPIMARKNQTKEEAIDLMAGFVDGKLVSVAKGYGSSEAWQVDKEPLCGTIVYRMLSPEEYKEAEKFLENNNQ